MSIYDLNFYAGSLNQGVNKRFVLAVEYAIATAISAAKAIEKTIEIVTLAIDGFGACGIATLIEKIIAKMIEKALECLIKPNDVACQIEFVLRHKMTTYEVAKRGLFTEVHRCSGCKWIGHNKQNCPN
jgi:hypothetical protein